MVAAPQVPRQQTTYALIVAASADRWQAATPADRGWLLAVDKAAALAVLGCRSPWSGGLGAAAVAVPLAGRVHRAVAVAEIPRLGGPGAAAAQSSRAAGLLAGQSGGVVHLAVPLAVLRGHGRGPTDDADSETRGHLRDAAHPGAALGAVVVAQAQPSAVRVIEFAVGVDVTAEFRRAVSEVAEQDWQTLYRKVGEHRVDTGQQWAEVNFVPNWIGHSKNSPEYRFIATRERLIEQPLPGMGEQMELPFPAMELSNRGWYKVFGVVTNRSIAADELIWWSRRRCGKGEEVHGVLKSDLAGGRLPSGLFGANAAWWAIAVLAFNLNSAMKRLVLGGQWVGKRLKAVRFALIALPGRVVRHARRLIIRLARGHPSYELLLRARLRILALAAEPYRA